MEYFLKKHSQSGWLILMTVSASLPHTEVLCFHSLHCSQLHEVCCSWVGNDRSATQCCKNASKSIWKQLRVITGYIRVYIVSRYSCIKVSIFKCLSLWSSQIVLWLDFQFDFKILAWMLLLITSSSFQSLYSMVQRVVCTVQGITGGQVCIILGI